jgi:hypothetical protein
VLKYINTQAGRMEQFQIGDQKAIQILVKNPTGLNQALAALINDPSSKALFFALNDNTADGRDVSWIWDAQVETLTSPNAGVSSITCSGLKCFIAAVMGGIGSIPGAMIGGFVLGICEVMLVGFMPELSGYRDAFAFIVLILILLFRPGGILGENVVEKV